MNREVKFRGKARNMLYNGADILHHKGDWLYGDLIHQDGEVYITPVDIRYPDGTPMESFIVDADTVGQYTGLIDKNGVEIYEGDILTAPINNKRSIIFEVEYNTTLGVLFGGEHPYKAKYRHRKEETAILGNIHDNPELLTKDE